VAGPWTQIPGWQDQELLPRDLLGPISKQNLSTWRLANILALAYLSASVIPASASWMRNPFLGWVTNLGRNALEVFCAGTILSLVGFIVLVEVDRGRVTQLAVNFGGLLAMGLTAWWAGKRRRRRRNATDNSAASTSAILSTPSSTRRAAAQETALLHARTPSSVQPRGR
jgi:hypothetical protein